jgi:hypothetical protein
MNGMTRKDVQIVELPHPDDWYDNPEMEGDVIKDPDGVFLCQGLVNGW